jgi:hypothetical protein
VVFDDSAARHVQVAEIVIDDARGPDATKGVAFFVTAARVILPLYSRRQTQFFSFPGLAAAVAWDWAGWEIVRPPKTEMPSNRVAW